MYSKVIAPRRIDEVRNTLWQPKEKLSSGICVRRGCHSATTKRVISVFHVNQPEACCSVCVSCNNTSHHNNTPLALLTLWSVEPCRQLQYRKWRPRNSRNDTCVQRKSVGHETEQLRTQQQRKNTRTSQEGLPSVDRKGVVNVNKDLQAVVCFPNLVQLPVPEKFLLQK